MVQIEYTEDIDSTVKDLEQGEVEEDSSISDPSTEDYFSDTDDPKELWCEIVKNIMLWILIIICFLLFILLLPLWIVMAFILGPVIILSAVVYEFCYHCKREAEQEVKSRKRKRAKERKERSMRNMDEIEVTSE